MYRIDVEEITNLNLSELKRPTEPLVLYGAGGLGKLVLQSYLSLGFEILAVCDSNRNRIGEDFQGYKIRQFEEVLETEKNFLVVITAGGVFYDEIKKYLLKLIDPSSFYYINIFNNASSDKSKRYKEYIVKNEKRYNFILNNLEDDFSRDVLVSILKGNISCDARYFTNVSTKNQYFNALTNDEYEKCFIDAGAFNGDTLKKFIEFARDNYGKIVLFEPLKSNYENLRQIKNKYYPGNERIQILNKGLFRENTMIGFDSDIGESCARIKTDEKTSLKIETVSLDSLNISDVSFIKMDIEGSELEALKGCEGTIRQLRPKLAISVYHKIEDLLEIPEYIINLGLPYKYYLRHHGDIFNFQNYETVFYAV